MAKAKRRVHRKSRFGCDVCKRRHIKCDERRPVCTNCEVSQRGCVFQDDKPPANAAHGGLPVRAPSATLSATPAQEPTIPSVPNDKTAETGPVVDMLHAELLIHYSFSVAVPGFEPDLEKAATSLVLREGLAYPWLMYAILAISARHLAVHHSRQNPTRHDAQKYHDHAGALQTKALSLFNTDVKTIDAHNCTAAVLFASILGRHLLADSLGYLIASCNGNPRLDLDTFLERYDSYVNVHRGMRAIVSEAMSLLPNTESWPLMMWCGLGTTQGNQRDNHKRPQEDDHIAISCQLATLDHWITESVDSAPTFTINDASICSQAIKILETGLTDMATQTSPFRRHQVAVIWAVLCPPAFQNLLHRRCSQALVVLAYYGVILHHARDIWQVAGAGPPLIRMLADYLGPEYGVQMEWPLANICGTG